MHRSLRTITGLLMLIGAGQSSSHAEAASLELGPIVVGGRSKLSGDAPSGKSWEAQSSFGAGLRADLILKDDVRLCFEPSYLSFNSDLVRRKGGEVLERTKFEFESVVLPLILRVSGTGPGVRGFVAAGLEVDVLLSATRKDLAGVVDIDDRVKELTPRANFGVGVQVPSWGHSLFIEGRLSQGLTNAAKMPSNSDPNQFPGASLKLEGLQLWVGYVFVLGGDR